MPAGMLFILISLEGENYEPGTAIRIELFLRRTLVRLEEDQNNSSQLLNILGY